MKSRRGKTEVFDATIDSVVLGLEEWRVRNNVEHFQFFELLSIIGDTKSNHRVFRHARKFVGLILEKEKFYAKSRTGAGETVHATIRKVGQSSGRFKPESAGS